MKIVAAGDSVVWGQGLLHVSKFVSLLHKQMTGAPWPIAGMRARSGAIIGISKMIGVSRPASGLDAGILSEVPLDAPTIVEQVRSTPAAEAAAADLLILNGGINDVGVNTLLSAHLFDSERLLDPSIQTYCYSDMMGLLAEARARFPRATIAVLGYYPLLSDDSNIAWVALLLFLLGSSAGVVAGVLASAALTSKIVRNALYFHQRQLYWLRRAVTDFNRRSHSHAGVLFVHPGFTARNSVGATTPLLFQPTLPPSVETWITECLRSITSGDLARLVTVLTTVDPHDPQNDMRRAGCNVVYASDIGLNMRCRVAAIGHPNEPGAACIAQSIRTQCEQYWSISMREHLAILQRGRSTLSLRGGLSRFGLEPESGWRACSQQMYIDSIQVTIQTKNLPNAGTDNKVFFSLGEKRKWLLNESVLPLDPLEVFEPGHVDHLAIDPFLIAGAGRLHVGDVSEIRLTKESPPLIGNEWQPESIVVEFNGHEVFRSDIHMTLGNGEFSWVAATPPYPLP